MGRVTGLGGVFLKSQDPERLREWYRDRLGIDIDDYGASFAWRERDRPDALGYSVWGVFRSDTRYFAPSHREFMVNFRVESLAAVLADLRAAGERVDERVEDIEQGKFGWVMDPDGTRVELWEPPPVDVPDLAAAVVPLVHEFLAAVDAGDEATLTRCFAAEAAVYLPFADSPELIIGREAILARFERLFAAYRRRGKKPPYVSFEPRELAVTSLGPGMALVTFAVAIGAEIGRRSLVARLTPDGWRIVHLHASNITPR